MYRRLLKALHALGAIGFMGGLAACLVLVANTAVEPTPSFAAVRQGIALINKWPLTIVGNGQKAAAQAAAAVAGQPDAMTRVTEHLRTEWGALWLMLALGLVNIVLAIWRPRLSRRRAATS